MKASLISNTFATSDRYLTAYLLSKSIEFIGVGFDGKFTTFIFPIKKIAGYHKTFETDQPIQDFVKAFERVQDIVMANRRRNE